MRTAVRERATAGSGVPALLIVAVGSALIGVTASGEHRNYVQPAMAVPLVLTGAAFVALGVWSLVSPARDDELAGQGEGHHASSVPWSAWLLLVPVLASVLISPPPLGSVMAQRREPLPVTPRPASAYLPLPPGDPLGVPLGVYADRATAGGEASLEDRRFTITGFVTPRPGGWLLTRVRIRCCAADATPVFVRAVGAAEQPADRWVSVTGRYLPTDGGTAQLEVSTVLPSEPLANPYIVG